MKNIAIYIHWPFCKSKCPYCDFNSHVRERIDYNRWLSAYIKEIENYFEFLTHRTITSIFFGGGTPSLMPVEIVAGILTKLNEISKFDLNIEITLEANPTSVEAEKFADLSKVGVNRISLGVQSFNQQNLKFLGREHTVQESLKAIETADKNFSNFSFDIMYALPNQSLKEWEKELEYALSLAKYHISLYQLTIEKGTNFYRDFRNHAFTLPTDDESAELYELTDLLTASKGLLAYEISNYAKSDYKSRHNISYWQYKEYLGIGAGAHSRVNFGNGLEARMNFHLPEKWLEDVHKKNSSIQTFQTLQPKEIAEEFILMALRLNEGLNKSSFFITTGIKLEDFINHDKLLSLENNKLLVNNEKNIFLTFKGKLLLNQIVKFLL